MPCFGCNLSSTAVDENGIYVAVTGGNLYSLNRDTGAVQWATPLTGGMRYNGVAVANGIVYSLNDAVGALQAFDASSGAPLFSHPFQQDTGEPMHDMGNSSGVSVARNMVFATSQADGTSTLFALKLGATGDPGGDDGGGGERRRAGEEPPPTTAAAARATASSRPAPARTSYGYLTPIVTINKGGTVSYTNADAVKHNVASPDGLFRSELADSGETVPVAGVEKLEPGTYEFLCEPHPNMKGQLTGPVMMRTRIATLAGVLVLGLGAFAIAEEIEGTDEPDTINGTEQADSIEGGRGEDTINGLGGDDTLDGNGDNDVIKGGDGNDKLFGAGCEVGELGRICDNVGRDRLHGRAGRRRPARQRVHGAAGLPGGHEHQPGHHPDRWAGQRQAARRREARRAARGAGE